MDDRLKGESSRLKLLLTRAHVVLPDRVIENASLLIEGERITGIYKHAEDVLADVHRTFDLQGLTLLPGFIDLHIHGAMGVDVTDAESSDDLHKVACYLAAHGTTAWLPTLVPAPVENYKRAARLVKELIVNESEREPASRSLGLHYEGPFVNEAQCGALRPRFFQRFSNTSSLDAIALVGHPRARHMITVAPEIEGGIELVRELSSRGFIVSIGHTRADIETLDRAHEAGARHLTHFMNAMIPPRAREPGAIGWGLMRDDATCDVIADGVHVGDIMLRLIMRCKESHRTLLISDAVAPAGLGDGEFQFWDETIAVENKRTRNERGDIAGSVAMLNDCARTMHRLGAKFSDIAQMASYNPACLIGIERDYGSIETGKRADLVAFDTEWNARLTIIGGRVAFDER
jgi:N-acetylglucosamine-6-phosphate deacetylase